MACSIDGNPEIVNELLATVSIVVNTATKLSELFLQFPVFIPSSSQ